MGGRGSWSETRNKEKLGADGARRKVRPVNIDQYRGWSLQQIEEHIRGMENEMLFVLDANDNVVAAYQGGPDSVSFPQYQLIRKGATVTHNHPVGTSGYGGTLSITDVLNMAASNWAEHRATAAGSGEMNYIIRRTPRTTEQNSKDLFSRVQRDAPALRKQMKQASDSLKNPSALSRRQAYVGILDRYYSEVLPQYNFEYVARSKQYTYNR